MADTEDEAVDASVEEAEDEAIEPPTNSHKVVTCLSKARATSADDTGTRRPIATATQIAYQETEAQIFADMVILEIFLLLITWREEMRTIDQKRTTLS